MTNENPATRADAGFHGVVCVVDEDVGVRNSLRLLMELHGVPVVTLASGEELLERVELECPALLITEIELRGVGGFGLKSALQSRGFFIPTMGITSNLDLKKARRARELGFLDLVEKPIVYESILRMVREVLKVEIPVRPGDPGIR